MLRPRGDEGMVQTTINERFVSLSLCYIHIYTVSKSYQCMYIDALRSSTLNRTSDIVSLNETERIDRA